MTSFEEQRKYIESIKKHQKEISDKYFSMFDPYSTVWEVSGTATPMWTWKYSLDENGNPYAGDTYNMPDDKDADKNKVVDTTAYDVRTNGMYAPFSQFSRWQMLDYRGIKGVMFNGDRQLINRYFDTSLARSGEVWSLQEPTYANIIEAYDSIDAARYRIQDFIYNKYFRMIPPNYLITLRRYGMPCGDAPFTLAYPEELHKEINTESVLIPLSTATTYMSELAGNKMDDVLKFSWGMNFTEKTSEIQTISSGTPGASSFGFGQWLDQKAAAAGNGNTNLMTALRGGFAMSGVNFWASTKLTPATRETAAAAAQVDPWAKYGKYTQGPVDVIMKTKIRDQGLNFTNDFNLKFEYELKSLQYVNPKIAMLDIIGNMITMSTNSGAFWGGATRYYGNGGGYGKQPGNLDAFRKGDYATYAKSLVDHVTDQVKTMNDSEWPKGLEDWVKLAKQIFSGGLNNMIGGLINGNLGKLGFTQPANALLNDKPTGYWHVTIGNPLNPIAMMGNMVCTDMEMTMGEGLGYDDFPVNVAFTCKVSHGKPRDAAAIEAIFNAGKGRYMHTPFAAEIKDLPQEMQDQYAKISEQRKSADPMNVDRNRGLSKNQNGAPSGKSFKDSARDPETGFQKTLYNQIDNVIRLIR